MTRIRAIFSQVFPSFPQEMVNHFADQFEEKSLQKGDLLLREGQVCDELVFILSGSMMCYYLKDGKRFIDEFSLDNEFITDYSSFITRSPSNKSIECIEDCTVISIRKTKMDELYQLPEMSFDRLGRVMAEQIFMQWHEKSKSLLMDNATERYLKLIHNRPLLPQRVPQYLIAEYLGITPESLSRVRKSLL